MVDSRKKIVVFINSMGGGGAERVVSLLLEPLSVNYDVTLIVMFPTFVYEVPKSVRIISLLNKKPVGVFQNIISIPKLIYKYLREISIIQPSIVISFLFKPNLINSLAKLVLKDVKIILSERNYPSIMYSTSKSRFWVSRFLIKWLYSRADIIFSNSKWINDDLKCNFNVNNVLYKVIYNPIILPKTVKCQQFNNNLKIVSVGRLIDIKNHKLILNALSVMDTKKKYSLTILGDGNLRKELISYTRTINLSNISFPGFSHDVKKDLLDYDLFILSSNSEGFPNALLEAMSIGLPVISTNCKSGPLELLNDNEYVRIDSGGFCIAKYGILINVGDVVGLAKAINYLIENPMLLKTLSKLSLKRAADFSLDKIYVEFSSILS